MSTTTAQLLGVSPILESPWRGRLRTIRTRLKKAHGMPSLGNFREPVREIFYILLSAKTTDSQYRKTHKQLYSQFPTLPDLAAAPVRAIRAAIAAGGLDSKRAGQIRKTARRLLESGGRSPSRFLRRLSVSEAFEFLVSLPGMGPKSAFCVMMYSLDEDVFPVDVNVQRIAERIAIIPKGLKHYQALRKMARVAPDGASRELHIGMVVHGRKVCLPLQPKCHECCLSDLCRHGQSVLRWSGMHGKEPSES